MSRRSGMVFLLPLVVTVAYVLLHFPDGEWGQWAWGLDLVTGTTVLTAPIVAACAAHLVRIQADLDEVLGGMPRVGWVPLRCAAQAWCWGAGVYVLTALAVVVVFLLRPHGGPVQLWASVSGLMVLAAAALAGSLLARAFPARITVLLVGPGVFLVGAFGGSPYGALLRHGPDTGSLAGLELDGVFWVLQVIALLGLCLGLAGAAWVVARWRGPGPRPALAVAVALVGLALCVGGGTAIERSHRQRLVLSDARPTVCAGVAPRICVSPASTHALRGTARAMRRAADELRRVGVGLPARYEELLPGYTPPGSVGMIDADRSTDSLFQGARNIASPAPCAAWTDPRRSSEVALEAQELVVFWIRARAGEPVSAWGEEADAWLSRHDRSAAIAWVRRTFAQLRSCDLAQIRLPYRRAEAR